MAPRFQEEMAIMKLLDHPNIVRLQEAPGMTIPGWETIT